VRHQHRLVLTAAAAYDNLVNVEPANQNAKADGLLRVKPYKSGESLLYHKLVVDNRHHGGKNYGNPMPLGSRPLTNGQIEFIRRWIEAGAPREGEVVDPKILDDTVVAVQPFEPLATPAPGQGLQVNLARFDVPANFEREFFLYKRIGNTQDVYVNRYAIKMRPGSHHLVAYTFADNTPAISIPQLDVLRDLRQPNGNLNIAAVISMPYHVMYAVSQTQEMEYSFPPGTAMLLPANAALDFNSHYVNKTRGPIPGEVSMNFYTVPLAQVRNVVRPLNWSNTSITLPPNQRSTLTRTFRVQKRTRIIALTSHMHKLGVQFVIRIAGGPRNGQVVYSTTDWEHPDFVNFPEPVLLNANEGLTSEITWNNTTNRTVSFGLTSDDEMGIIFGYYYEE
jgi:Copper type II ascorbate-dependent monooxygenase, C-terminal domain